LAEVDPVVEGHPVPVPGEAVGDLDPTHRALGDAGKVDGRDHRLVALDGEAAIDGLGHGSLVVGSLVVAVDRL